MDFLKNNPFSISCSCTSVQDELLYFEGALTWYLYSSSHNMYTLHYSTASWETPSNTKEELAF